MNPIVRRELLDLLRTRKAVAVQGGLAVATALLVLVRWPTEGMADLTGATGMQVLRVFGYGLLASLILILPAFPATSVVRERVRGTLALLLNSPMSVTSIYLGKLGGVLGFTAILLLATLPGAAACYSLGGSSEGGGVWLLYLVLAAAAVQIAALGLYVSGRALSIDGALRITYAAVLGLCAVPYILYVLLPHDASLTGQLVAWMACLSPIPPVMEAIGHGGSSLPGDDAIRGAWLRYLVVGGVFSLLCGWRTVRNLSRSPLDRPRPAGVMTQDRTLGERMKRRFLFLVDPQRRSGSAGWFVNPVMLKEFRTRRFGRSHWTIRLLALTAVLSLGLSLLAAVGMLGRGVDVIGGALVLLQSALLILFTPSLAAGLISTEREGGGWNLLRTTPLSAGKILRGKLLSVLWPLLLLFVATVPGYAVMTAVKPELGANVGRVLICLGVTAAFAVAVGSAVGSLFRTTAAATAAVYLVLTTVCVAPLLVWLGRDAPFGHRTVELALTVNPVAAALNAADMPGFREYNLIPANWWVMGGGCAAALLLLVARTRRLYRAE